jgi:hypothetical protein
MRFLGIDCHIGVRDIQYNFEQLGHNLTVWSISDHHFLMGWERAKVDIVNEKTWWNLDQDMCDQFYNRYKNELNKYDGFVSFYPPAFAMLYEKFEKPIIVHVPLRYEMPFFGFPARWNWLTKGLQKGIDSGQIISLVNDKLDQQYFKNYVQRDIELLPALCDYTNLSYIGDRKDFLYCGKFSEFVNWLPNVPLVVKQPGYSWEDLVRYKALVYLPYQNITMSIFEQYTMNIPLFFPTHEFLVRLWKQYKNKGVMSELSHRKIFGLPPGTPKEVKFDGIDLNDYNNLESFKYWTALSDFYDKKLMLHIQYYDSITDLEYQLNTVDFEEISARMEEANKVRKTKIMNQWAEVFKRIR